MHTFDLDCIGTHLHIRIDVSSSDTLDEDFSHIRERLIAFENRFSRFIPGNWLHDLNLHRRGILDTDGKNMITFALDLAKKTDGYFDPTVGKRLRDLGYGNPATRVQAVSGDQNSGEQSTEREEDYRDITLDGEQVILGRGVELEFGGVGKGYLLDVIEEMIESWNVGNLESLAKTNTQNLQNPILRYLINFGGDLYARGKWNVGLESPFRSDEVIGVIELDDRFLACSAGTKRKWGSHHHLIDPHTGASAQDVVATYIEGDTGMLVDGYATAFSVMPWERACETLELTPLIEGVLVRHDGSLYQSKGSQSEVFG